MLISRATQYVGMTDSRLLLAHPVDGTDRLTDAFRDAGWSVRTVETATAALATLMTEEFDCLVCARRLPGDDGLDLLAAIQQADVALPCVLFAPADESGLSEAAFEHGADSYVENNGAGSLDRLVAVVDELGSTAVGGRKQDVSDHEPSGAKSSARSRPRPSASA